MGPSPLQVCLIDTRVRNLLFCSFALYSLLITLLLKIAHFKERPWAICSLSLFFKEQHEWFACDSSESLSKNNQFAQFFKYIFHVFFTAFPLFLQSLFAPLLFFKERQEQFALQKSGCEWITLFQEQIALSLTKNRRFALKIKEPIVNPDRHTLFELPINNKLFLKSVRN